MIEIDDVAVRKHNKQRLWKVLRHMYN